MREKKHDKVRHITIFSDTVLARLPTSQVASKPTIASWLSVVAS